MEEQEEPEDSDSQALRIALEARVDLFHLLSCRVHGNYASIDFSMSRAPEVFSALSDFGWDFVATLRDSGFLFRKAR